MIRHFYVSPSNPFLGPGASCLVWIDSASQLRTSFETQRGSIYDPEEVEDKATTLLAILSTNQFFKGKKMSKISVITGAAGGIGRAIAYQLAKEGCDTILVDINLGGTKSLAKEIESLNRKAFAIKADVSKSKEVNRMVSTTLNKFGRIDILVNCAGGSARERQSLFNKSSEEIWDFVIGINLKGVLNCSRAVINQMIEQKSGKIVNIASYAGICGVAGVADYSAAKAGIIGFTKALAKEIASYGININCVSPGPIETPGFLKGFPPETLERMKKSTGFNRLGKPEEIANMVAFLVSEKASFITGQNFPVCGIRNLGS